MCFRRGTVEAVTYWLLITMEEKMNDQRGWNWVETVEEDANLAILV